MKIRKLNEQYLIEMSNVVGNKVKNPGKLPFSFFFSANDGNPHGIRVKISFDPQTIKSSNLSTLKLNSDWAFMPGPDDKNVKSRDIRKLRVFFKKYIILFCAVWDEQINQPEVEDYFRGDITLHDLITKFDFYSNHQGELDEIESIEELEEFCRENNLVNFHGN